MQPLLVLIKPARILRRLISL